MYATLAALARASDDARPPGMADETFAKLRGQAHLQLIARERGRDEYELLPLEADAGFALLPAPSPGDLFFDFEGNPFWDHEGSLEYLWGQTDADDEFAVRWATDHDGERAAFEAFVDEVHARLAAHPDLHVYHYAQYEITALRRMMGRYGTREAELDDLLRREVFVDLYKVVKGGLRISRPGYGLKEIEHLIGFERTAEIREGGTSIVEFERWMVERDDAILAAIAAYNREDCIATRVLRDWLLERRADALERFGPFPAPEAVESKPVKPEKEARRALRETLLDSGDPLQELAAQLLDYHDRERKPFWWAFFDRLDLTAEELVEDAEAIGGLAPVGEPRPEKKSTVFAFTYPPQQQKLGSSPVDPATGWRAGEVVLHDSRGAHARAEARPGARQRAAPGRADPRRRLLDEGTGGGARAVRSLAPRRRRGVPRARVDPPPRCIRSGGADHRPGRDGRAAARDRPRRPRARAAWRPRPATPRDPGPARFGEDVDRGQADRAARRGGEVGRRRLDEPPGDPQAPGRGRDRRDASVGCRSRA